MINFKNVTKNFHGKDILKDVSGNVEKGQVVCMSTKIGRASCRERV